MNSAIIKAMVRGFALMVLPPILLRPTGPPDWGPRGHAVRACSAGTL
jgi:hypothetical protein